MLISVASDLHHEFARDGIPFTPPYAGEDVRILAGDIQMGLTHGQWFLELLKDSDVIYVLGNHEFYKEDIHQVYLLLDSWTSAINKIAKERGYKGRLYSLQDNIVDINGVRFIGSTLWTNYRGMDPWVLAAAEQLMPDYTHIRSGKNNFTPADGLREHMYSAHFIKEELAKHPDMKKVVITHHLPSFKSVSKKFIPSPDDRAFAVKEAMNYYFCSELDELVAQADIWVHGHTHDSVDYEIGKCRVICNPRGYPRDKKGVRTENENFKSVVVEV